MSYVHQRYFRLERLSMYRSDMLAAGWQPNPDDWEIVQGPHFTDLDIAVAEGRRRAKSEMVVYRVAEVFHTVIQILIIDSVESDISGI